MTAATWSLCGGRIRIGRPIGVTRKSIEHYDFDPAKLTPFESESLIVENPDTFDADAIGKFLDLGPLKATTGDQAY